MCRSTWHGRAPRPSLTTSWISTSLAHARTGHLSRTSKPPLTSPFTSDSFVPGVGFELLCRPFQPVPASPHIRRDLQTHGSYVPPRHVSYQGLVPRWMDDGWAAASRTPRPPHPAQPWAATPRWNRPYRSIVNASDECPSRLLITKWMNACRDEMSHVRMPEVVEP